jgi:hypothetical protein
MGEPRCVPSDSDHLPSLAIVGDKLVFKKDSAQVICRRSKKNHLHLARVTFDEDIIVPMANPTVPQLLPLWKYMTVIPGSNIDANIDLRALQKTGILTNGCGLPAIVFPAARPWFPATYESDINELIYCECDIDPRSNARFSCSRRRSEDRQRCRLYLPG